MATKPQEPESSDFDDAFAAFANPDPAPADPAPAADPANDDPGGAADPAPSGGDPAPAADGGDPAGDAGAAPAGDPEPAADPAPATAGADDPTDALIAKLAGLVKDAPSPAPAPAAADPAPASDPVPDLYNDAEKEFLAKYDEDWGDVSRGEALKRRAEYRDLVSFVFEQVAAQLRPMAETVDVLSSRTHLADLRGQVEDYDTVRDKVISWVEEQPTYLQTGMKSVIQSGTADEVADLINRYRQATGDTVKPAAPPAASVELSSDAKKAAEALAPVNTKRTAVPAADDPGDFDAAFAQWASRQSNK